MKLFNFLTIASLAFITFSLFSCGEDHCGDGIVDIDEQCDDGNNIDSDDCTNFCEFPACGDGIINQDLEECDDANLINGDGCDENCQLELLDKQRSFKPDKFLMSCIDNNPADGQMVICDSNPGDLDGFL
ncbi:MAG: DUF4215 domain-containing protein [Deltaproteobacteria bacterium]|nr:DUF4215 domain-containing protein [Deltaproteobacteria bacterium]